VQFEVIFYTKANGKSPIEDFLNSLDVKSRARTVGLIQILIGCCISFIFRARLF